MGEAAAGAMPSERKSSRRRTRTKNRGLRQPRCKVSRCDAGCSARNPAVGSHREGSAVGCQDGAAGLRAEMRQCLQKIWEYRQLWLIVSSFCAVLLLCFYLGLGSSNSRSSNEQSLENSSAWEIVLNFFYPTTCIPKENQVVKPCNEQQNYKKTECLVNRCCFSSSKISNVNCFVPLQDKPTQMFRMFVLGVIITIILGCLPICWSSFWRRSKWANPLRKRVNRIVKNMKKHRKKEKKDAETIEKTAEDEEKSVSENQ